MRKVMLGLLVAVLVVGSVLGYSWWSNYRKEAMLQKLYEECRGEGYALINYNGSVVKAHYRFYPSWRWVGGEKNWFCDVDVQLVHPVNGIGAFEVPREEFESKYLVRYLSNTTTSTTLLENLNGEWISAGGEPLTIWWNNLPEVKASQIWDYINNLWDRMENSQKYYDYTFPSSQWRVPPKPLPNQTVKVYSIRLWYGARLDILAYQNPTDPTKIEVIEYGTVENWTKFTEIVNKITIFYGYTSIESVERNPLLMADYYTFKTFNKTMWIGWKIKLAGEFSEGRFLTDSGTLEPEIVMLLEEPMLTSYHWYNQMYSIEFAFWQVIGFPSFGLASNILLPQNPDAETEGEWIAEVARNIVLNNVSYPSNEEPVWKSFIIYPSLLREFGMGVCHEQSLSTVLFVSSLGIPGDYMHLNTTKTYGNAHAIGFVIIPSSVDRNVRNGIPSLVDIDKDGDNDTLVLIVDTAGLTRTEILSFRTKEYPILPFSLPDVVLAENEPKIEEKIKVLYNGYATGMIFYPDRLPESFVPPWWRWVKKIYPHNNYTVDYDPWKWFNPEFAQDIPIRFSNNTVKWIHVNVTTCISIEQVYNNLIAPLPKILDYGYEGWVVNIPVSLIVKSYVLTFKKLGPSPENIALQPPITPANIGNPPTLKETVPQLEQWIEARIKIDYNGNIQILETQVTNCNR